jgi:hypothetical protein
MDSGVAEGVGPEFKPQYCQEKKKYPWVGPGGIAQYWGALTT